jgi:hypothetical protein
MSDLDDELEKKHLADRWKLHRRDCLDMAIRMGVGTAEQAIELAEKFSAYIRIGKQDEPKT